MAVVEAVGCTPLTSHCSPTLFQGSSALFPLVFSFIGLMIPETDSKHMIWPALFTQITTTTVESIMANKGLLPFWFYSYRHYIGLAYIVIFITNFVAMRRLHKRR